jgi:tellurite resistance protein TerA
MWNFLRPGGADPFQAGIGTTHVVELTCRHPVVSLTRQGAAAGNLRVNLSWAMRSTDTNAWPERRGSWLKRQFSNFRPEPVQAAGPAVVDVDLDLACMYELANGSKGVVQPLGNFLGSLDTAPYIKLSGDDRFGGTSGETLFINFDKREEFRRILVFVYIYDGTPAFDRTHAKVEIYPTSGPRIEIPLDEREPQARSCAVVLIENVKGELLVRREVKYVYGFQAELDRLYGWGLQWGRGFKTKV